MPYLSASAVVIHYEEALYQVYASLPYLYFYLCCGWPDDLKHSLPDNLSNFNRQLQALVENVFVFSVRVQLAHSMCFDDALYKFTYLLTSSHAEIRVDVGAKKTYWYRLDIGKYSLTVRSVKLRNSLPNHVLEAQSK